MTSEFSDQPTEIWVDSERGVVSRDVFVSQEIYQLELEQIFDKSWIYLAHETEIPETGDYVVRQLGSAPVIVVRLEDGTLRVLLNSCRHRGAKLCRADSGNSAGFVCPFHGWSYGRDGALITTGFDHHFPDNADFSKLGLVSAPRVESYKGLIFGCWNDGVSPLADYLGDIGWYLDAFFGRTPKGMEVLAPPHRWRTKTNWKVGSLNFIGDSQHTATTHIGPSTLDMARSIRDGFRKAGQDSFHVLTDEGHGCTLTYLAPGMPAKNYLTHPEIMRPLYQDALGPDQMDMLRHLRVCVGTVFPNLSFIESQVGAGEKAVIIRLWQPVSATEMEVLSWVFAEVEAPADYKERALRNGFHNFGAAGVFEQDDMELWASATAASDNPIARQYPYSFQTSLRYLDNPAEDHPWPGRAHRPADTEVAQFAFMRRWDAVMRSNR
ncbi:MAG: Rieske 2Fe-2S domain-containing protein [Rhodospirillaceae bacterium]|nr:Rieske 2Fe-2S domain-containing protein [Rhodospirillaceae bacterium]